MLDNLDRAKSNPLSSKLRSTGSRNVDHLAPIYYNKEPKIIDINSDLHQVNNYIQPRVELKERKRDNSWTSKAKDGKIKLIAGKDNHRTNSSFDYKPYKNLPSLDTFPFPQPISKDKIQVSQGSLTSAGTTTATTSYKKSFEAKVQTGSNHNGEHYRSRSTDTRVPRTVRDETFTMLREIPRSTKGKSKAEKELAHRDWVVEKRQLLNQVYGTTYVKDIERMYRIKLSETSTLPSTSNPSYKNDSFSDVNSTFNIPKERIKMKHQPKSHPLKKILTKYEKNTCPSLSQKSPIKSIMPYFPNTSKTKMNTSKEWLNNPAPPTGDKKAFVRKIVVQSTLPALNISLDTYDRKDLRNLKRIPTPIPEERGSCSSFLGHRKNTDEESQKSMLISQEDEFVEMALLNTSECMSLGTSSNELNLLSEISNAYSQNLEANDSVEGDNEKSQHESNGNIINQSDELKANKNSNESGRSLNSSTKKINI